MIGTLVFREKGYSRQNNYIDHVYEHNERTAKSYQNTNIDLSLSGRNFYYVKPTGTYRKMLEDKLEKGELSVKGLKEDAKVFSEILIAVNRDFWQDKDDAYIKKFFDTAYAFLRAKYGDNILSCVVHCDETSDGKVNYHMHAVCLPVVEKKRYYSKRSKVYQKLLKEEPDLAADDERLLKGVENQISHNKFYNCQRDPHTNKMLYSYAIWQDELMGYIKKAGFTDIQRGSEGQRAIHMHPNAFKRLMERIEYEAELEQEKLNTEMKEIEDGNYLLSPVGVKRLSDYKQNLCKQKAAYDLAVVALEEEQTKVYERQNKAFSLIQRQLDLNKDYDELIVEYSSLKQENMKLSEQIQELIKQILMQNQVFAMLIKCLKKIYEVVQTPPNTTLQNMCSNIKLFIETSLNDEVDKPINR